MNKTMGAAGLILLAASGSAFASGYRIPEQSVNSTARAGSYVAYTPGADATYYNPANMSWLENRGYLEADATWIHLSSIQYTDSIPSRSGESEEENFFMPTFFAVSPDYNKFRVGFSVTAPAGLSKRWLDPYPRRSVEEFTLKVIDVNPTLSYKFCDRWSVGAGVRAIYSDGIVTSNANNVLTRDLEGDSWDAGYNVAFTGRPVDDMNVSVTYRSKVDLSIEGDARLGYSSGSTLYAYNGSVEVEIPLPAVLAVAASSTFFDQLTVELEYDRTYWSAYESLDFNYSSAMTGPLASFDAPVAKRWSDSDAWRMSLTYDLKNNFILMAGIAIDQNPVPALNLGFELPDSDAMLYSLGLRYQVNKDLELGCAYLYDDKGSRNVKNGGINGTFDDAAAHLVTVGVSYKL